MSLKFKFTNYIKDLALQMIVMFNLRPKRANLQRRTYRGTILARVPPVPVLSKMPVGTGLALRGRVGGAVLSNRCPRRTLVAY